MKLKLAQLSQITGSAKAKYLGFDVGGSSVKWGCLQQEKGFLAETPLAAPKSWQFAPGGVIPLQTNAHPQDVLAKILECCDPEMNITGLGLALPSVVKNNVVLTAANISLAWLDFPVTGPLQRHLSLEHVPRLLNDADAAGLAETTFGDAAGLSQGVTLMLTLGTGIGSALFVDGKLVPNTELGHLQYGGMEAEHWAAARVRTAQSLTWEQWGRRLGQVIQEYCRLLWPDHIVLGGAVSEKFLEFIPHVRAVVGHQLNITQASLGNHAGWLGSALAAAGMFPFPFPNASADLTLTAHTSTPSVNR